MKTLLTLAVAALVGGTPALADPKPASSPTAVPTGQPAAATPSAKTRYCVMTEATTGTRIGKRVCQTRDAWLDQGFDPLARR